MNEVLSGDKPLQFEVSVNTKSALIIGGVIFVAVAAAYFFIKGISKA